ncbi:MAG: histidine phosphatase family protein [Haloferacaceae archaeon]
MARVLLARHGETTWIREGRLQGLAPVRLTDRGHDQVEALGEALAARAPDRLRASDLHRSLRTARAVAGPTGLDAVPDRAWRARDVGRLQGLDAETAFERFPRFSVARRGEAALTERPDGGESVRDARRRVLSAFDRLVAGLAPDETVAVLTHADAVRAIRCAVADDDLVAATLDGSVPPASITEVAAGDGERSLVAAGETSHLD